MSNYAFNFQGQTFTPDGRANIADTAAHNAAVEAKELEYWQTRPDRFVAYYSIPTSVDGSCIWFGRGARAEGKDAYVMTWLGTRLGDITYATRYRHNFGGRFVSLRVRGTNGAEYHGRASWDNGQIIRLRRVK